MNKVRALGLPAHIKARIVKSLQSVGLYGAEVGGIIVHGMTDFRSSSWQGSQLEEVFCPLGADGPWGNHLRSARARSDSQCAINCGAQADRFGGVPDEDRCWRAQGQWFFWEEAAPKTKWDSARGLCAAGALKRADSDGLASCLSTSNFQQVCARCGEAGLENIVHHCPHRQKERRESGLPTTALEVPPCVRLHGLLPAPEFVPPPTCSCLTSWCGDSLD
eukprot:4602229-Amphidinium_carterae.1